MRKILYIHGLSSSGNSRTANTLSALLPEDKIISPDLPIAPQKSLNLLYEICAAKHPDLLIGTSMGGMFAQQIRGYKKILINPAFHVSEFMRKNIGTQAFLNKRKDGIQNYEITTELCDAYLEMENKQFDNITSFDKENTYAFFGEQDELVNCYEEYHKYYEHCMWFFGGHRLKTEDIEEYILPLINDIIKQ